MQKDINQNDFENTNANNSAFFQDNFDIAEKNIQDDQLQENTECELGNDDLEEDIDYELDEEEFDEEQYYEIDDDDLDEEMDNDSEEEDFEQQLVDLPNEDIRKIVLDCYKNVDNFYGLYYEHYHSKTFQWTCKGIAICIALALWCFLVPFIIKVDFNIWVLLFVAVWTVMMLVMAFFYPKNHPIHILYYKQNGNPVFLYWDIKNKQYYIINYGQKKKLKYFIQLNEWNKCSSGDIAPKKMYFDQLKGNLKLHQIDRNKQLITCYTKKDRRLKKSGSLMIENDKPVFIECIVYRTGYTSNFVKRKFPCNRRIDFVEFNTNKCINLPKSLIRYCKKKKIEPPEESDFLHLV